LPGIVFTPIEDPKAPCRTRKKYRKDRILSDLRCEQSQERNGCP